MSTFETTLLKNAPCGIIRTDEKMNILYWNDEMEQLTGLDSTAVSEKKMSAIRFFEPNHETLLNMRECLKGKKTNIARTAFIEHISGTRTLVFINARYIHHKNDTQLMITVVDISREISCSSISATPLIIKEKDALQRIIGRDPKIIELYRMIELAADSLANVNISGESGTGKELVADAIHTLSPRNHKPFVKVNCSALTETLLESELFGHVKGSFTGAYKDKPGKFETAGGGTVFIDEIGEISPMIQVKLLRVIQEKTIERVGDNKPIKVDMRIITATNRNLRELVQKGLFREDLYYRLNVFPIHTSPLRERKNDIPLLTQHFIHRFNEQTGKSIKGLTEDAYRILMDYCWPGNVRELENSIEHAFVLCNSKLIDVFDLPQDIRLVPLRQGLCKNVDLPGVAGYFLPKEAEGETAFRSITKDDLKKILLSNNYNRKETAIRFGISRVALWKKMKKFGLPD
jgi:PAS domain S-box-containing protein